MGRILKDGKEKELEEIDGCVDVKLGFLGNEHSITT